MISSEFDERGYTVEAEGFRDYIAGRIERNGSNRRRTEAADFAAILYRRLFVPPTAPSPRSTPRRRMAQSASRSLGRTGLRRLGAGRTLARFPERLAIVVSLPSRPDGHGQGRLVRHAGFQRVRSTVSIFALTAYHWDEEHRAGRWAPD